MKKDNLILALDVSVERALTLVKELKGYISIFKVGAQLFCQEGPDVVKSIKEEGGKVFLDLKFHDIPNTVARATEAAVELGVYMCTLHTLGGCDMMHTAVEAAQEKAVKVGVEKPLLLGVTVLTSIDQTKLNAELGIEGDVALSVIRLAKLAKEAGLDGVVSSPLEIEKVRKECGRDFIIVTPGIRPADTALHDQKRIATPQEALRKGANFIVLGRAITQAEDPRKAIEEL